MLLRLHYKIINQLAVLHNVLSYPYLAQTTNGHHDLFFHTIYSLFPMSSINAFSYYCHTSGLADPSPSNLYHVQNSSCNRGAFCIFHLLHLARKLYRVHP